MREMGRPSQRAVVVSWPNAGPNAGAKPASSATSIRNRTFFNNNACDNARPVVIMRVEKRAGRLREPRGRPVFSMTHPTESRYSRQSRFAPLGPDGQERIRAASVAVIGCGALGTVEAEILVRAGVGRLRIIDRDFVEWSNLQRQFLFEESDAAEGLPKAIAAARRLARVNSEVTIEPLVADLTPANIEDLLEGVELILDGTDNFEVRFLVNDYAVSSGIPWIYAAAVGSYGLKLAIVPGRTACLRCVYPEPPQGSQPTCETEGVLGPVTAAIASLAVRRCAEAAGARAGVRRDATDDRRRLVGRNPPNRAARARSRLPLLRPPRFRPSYRPAPRAHQPVRPQRRPDS